MLTQHLVKDEPAGPKSSNDSSADHALSVREPPPSIHHRGRVGQADAGAEEERVAEHEGRQVGRVGGEKHPQGHDPATQRRGCLDFVKSYKILSELTMVGTVAMDEARGKRYSLPLMDTARVILIL